MRLGALLLILVASPAFAAPKAGRPGKGAVDEPVQAPPAAAAAPDAAAPAAAGPSPTPATDPAGPPPVPRFQKIAVGDCGCALYAPNGMTFGEPELSPDGSKVWTAEVPSGAFHFAAVVVRFPAPMDLEPAAAEELLIAYLEFLKGQLDVQGAVGVGRGHQLESHPPARGVIDYWQSGDGERWAIKGWIDGERLAVLMIRGPEEYPYFNASQMYFNGFRFQP